MKDYYKIVEYESGTKIYYNENNQRYRLTGPAIEWYDGDKTYDINDIRYIRFYKKANELYIHYGVLQLIKEYEKYIKQNIKDLIQEYNPEIKLF